jgi:hypothetical protein
LLLATVKLCCNESVIVSTFDVIDESERFAFVVSVSVLWSVACNSLKSNGSAFWNCASRSSRRRTSP